MKPIGVTETIKMSGIGPDYDSVPEAYLNAKAQLGKRVHELCAMAAKGNPPRVRTEAGEYALKFYQWLKWSGAVVVRTEFEVKGEVSGTAYIGHADLDFIWDNRRFVADIKTTASLYSSYGVQLAAYAMAIYTERNWANRAVLWIRKDGPARLVADAPIIRESDFAMWRSIVISQSWIRGAKL